MLTYKQNWIQHLVKRKSNKRMQSIEYHNTVHSLKPELSRI